MSFLGDWMASKRARWQRDALADLAEQRRHERRAALAGKPDKAPAELVEMHLLESNQLTGPESWLGLWRDRADLHRDFGWGGYGVGGQITSHIRRRGADFPFFANEQELAILRDASRLIVESNPKAQGLVYGWAGYVIGDGATVRAAGKKQAGDNGKAVAELAQQILDGFLRRIDFDGRQEEFIVMSRRDGESALRIFDLGDGQADVRKVWPEQIKCPAGWDTEDWSFGVQTFPDDAEKDKAFAVFPVDGDATEEAEIVPAEEMIIYRANVDRGVRRGRPDFVFGLGDTMDRAERLAENMGEGSAQQAAIAYIRQHVGYKQAQIVEFSTADATYTKPDPFGGPDAKVKVSRPGSIIDTNQGTEFIPSPYSAGIAGHLEVAKMLDRVAAVKFNAFEWLVNADASSNSFANALSQESPFVRRVKSFQRQYATPFRVMCERVLSIAAKGGLLPANVLDLVEVKVTFPSPEIRNRLEESQRNEIDVRNGVLDPQTWAEEAGREFHKVQENLKVAKANGWTPPAAGPTPGEKPGLPAVPQVTEELLENFTGTKKDSLGREYHYVDGKRVASRAEVEAAGPDPTAPAGGDPATTRDATPKKPPEVVKQVIGEVVTSGKHSPDGDYHSIPIGEIRAALAKAGVTDRKAQDEAIMDATHRDPDARGKVGLAEHPDPHKLTDDERANAINNRLSARDHDRLISHLTVSGDQADHWRQQTAGDAIPRGVASKLKDHLGSLTGDPAEHEAADAFVAELGKLSQAELFKVMDAAGIEGGRSTDSKADLLKRAHSRMTARARARERAEV
jgi:hypothetical protein